MPEGAVSGTIESNLALSAASGAGFVVGGIYEFQPPTLTLNPAATLVITYTNEAAIGVNESQIRMFRWNAAGNNWQLIPNQTADPASNRVSASITQLGTFTLGYDATPPRINILQPVAGSVITNTLPLISALVVDEGVGIDPATVEMKLDGQVVNAEFVVSTGELVYLAQNPLSSGQHTIQISARDVLGNSGTATTTFVIRRETYLYLPLVLR
mgnify:CR=1 FL=1